MASIQVYGGGGKAQAAGEGEEFWRGGGRGRVMALSGFLCLRSRGGPRRWCRGRPPGPWPAWTQLPPPRAQSIYPPTNLRIRHHTLESSNNDQPTDQPARQTSGPDGKGRKADVAGGRGRATGFVLPAVQVTNRLADFTADALMQSAV